MRRLGQIDNIIYKCLKKDLPKKGEYARTILRIGICQLLFLSTPAHAAVDTSVKLAIQKKQEVYKKLIKIGCESPIIWMEYAYIMKKMNETKESKTL